MGIVVQKFGGTSLATTAGRRRVADHVQKARAEGHGVVVVVSAMGRRGAAYATDTLAELAAAAHGEVDPRDGDLLLACGEVISAVVVAQTLRCRGIAAVALTGAQAGIVTDSRFGAGRVREVHPQAILTSLDAHRVPVVAGFQGVTPDGEITTLGRGGSDTTASVLGAALGAERVEIHTDVDGILTADPKKVERATLLREAGYTEVGELAHQGTRVIHPRSVEIAARAGIPLWIRSTLGDGSGTRVHGIESDRPVTGVTSRPRIAFVRVARPSAEDRRQGLDVFRRLADEGVSVDFIDIRPREITFVVDSAIAPRVGALLDRLGFRHAIEDAFAKVSVVGAGMTGLPGVMARVVEALSEAGVVIHQATDSHTSISCLVIRDEEARALRALQRAFGLAGERSDVAAD